MARNVVQLRVPDAAFEKLAKILGEAGMELNPIHRVRNPKASSKNVLLSIEDSKFAKVSEVLKRANLEVVAYPGPEEDDKEDKEEKEDKPPKKDESPKEEKKEDKGKDSSATDEALWKEIDEIWEAIEELEAKAGGPEIKKEEGPKGLPPMPF
jgi:cobalamin biosynthesis protein CobT